MSGPKAQSPLCRLIRQESDLTNIYLNLNFDYNFK